MSREHTSVSLEHTIFLAKIARIAAALLLDPVPSFCYSFRSLFIQIVERLLIEKPDNPIGFIVEYLAKRYPDETRAAKIGHSMGPRENSASSHVTAVSR